MIHMIIQERGGIAKIYIFNNQIIIYTMFYIFIK